MARSRRKSPSTGGGNVTLTLTGSRQFSMVGYAHNPIKQWEQVVVVPSVAAYLLEQQTRDARTKQMTALFQEGVIKRPVRAARTEVDYHRELRTKRRASKNLDPNAALPEDERPVGTKSEETPA